MKGLDEEFSGKDADGGAVPRPHLQNPFEGEGGDRLPKRASAHFELLDSLGFGSQSIAQLELAASEEKKPMVDNRIG
jgi:hypothetical protein